MFTRKHFRAAAQLIHNYAPDERQSLFWTGEGGKARRMLCDVFIRFFQDDCAGFDAVRFRVMCETGCDTTPAQTKRAEDAL